MLIVLSRTPSWLWLVPAVLACSALTLLPASADPVRDGHVEAELISKHVALVPGQTATLGLRLQMDPHWHTYWKNPGDAGLATEIAWELPTGYTAHDIAWPAPQYFDFSGLASYGYEGEIVLPVNIDVPAGAEPGSQVTLRATADWLVCKDICIPGTAALSITLPIVAAADQPVADAKWEALFAWAQTRTPESLPSDFVSARYADGVLRLSIQDLRVPDAAGSTQARARFFPDDASQIEMSAPQTFFASDFTGFSLEFQRSPQHPEPETLSGVVVYRNGDQVLVYAIDTPVRRPSAAR